MILKFIKKETEKEVSFEMKNLPALKKEPYMDSPKDYLPKSSIYSFPGSTDFTYAYKYTDSWKTAAKELMSSKGFGAHLDKNLPGTEDLFTSLNKGMSERSKLLQVYEYVKKKLIWNGIKGIYISDVLKDVWTRKTCSAGEINMILTNLLRQAELDADPILISERNNGKVSTEYPFLGQFNSVYTSVKIDNKRYYLNAAESHLSPLHHSF